MSYRVIHLSRKSPYLARCAAWLMLCLIATAGPVAHAEDESTLTIRDVQVSLDEGVYELSAKVDLTLPDGARKAVESGLTLRLTYEITVDRVRRYMLDAGIAALEQRYEVSYHALSQRYLVKNLNTGEQHDFGSLQAALDRVADLHGLPVIDAALVSDGPVYRGRIRAVLGMNTAPDVFGWLLFWTDDWSAESDWKTWTLRP
ncbi:MAG: DUF4390 domain-containing protein [Steroidobacteraceae bacterium]|jgi:hypothetical protein|nr:DUF4390 domain-containing protein [Steroidobacteraceae bacterium]MBP9130375.1 DUF4390 domain-containing protein [Steroidobacteraceae bacterium]